jgi:hypothetical protein
MSYVLTPDFISSVTDVECAFSTVRLLPQWDDIPDDFKVGNIYTELTKAILYGLPLPAGEIELNDGVEAAKLNRCVLAHLDSFSPKHEHKVAGIAYMISRACTLYLPSPSTERFF